MINRIKKAVFPVAGLGTRFLPFTKATPKEMLPIVDMPLIHFAVEEACAAGITELIFITNQHKYAIQDHFASHPELESKLKQRQQWELLNIVKDILPKGVTCTYICQNTAEGLGHAVLCAKEHVGNEPFAVLLADELLDEPPNGCLDAMINLFNQMQTNIIAVGEVLKKDISKYGIVDYFLEHEQYHRIRHIIEKPRPAEAPSSMAVAGRYILQPSIFAALEATMPDAKGEVQLTSAITLLLENESAYAYSLQGKRYDCGCKLGFLKATIAYALQHQEVAVPFKAFLKDQISNF